MITPSTAPNQCLVAMLNLPNTRDLWKRLTNNQKLSFFSSANTAMKNKVKLYSLYTIQY